MLRKTWNWNATLRYFALMASIFLISACAAKLIDLDKSLPMLNLSEEQGETIKPKMEAIKEIADKYDTEKEEISSSLEEARSGGDRSQFQELRGKREDFLRRREAYLSAIRIHVADIKAALNQEQLAAFEEMEIPELEMPDTPMGRSGGRGGGREGGRGGMGGRSGRRGGGNF